MDCSKIIPKIRKSVGLIIAIDKDNHTSTGTGFIFKKRGILVTCNHVVPTSAKLFVKFADKDDYIGAKIAVRDDEHDLALLKIDDNDRDPLSPGDFNKVVEGMEVIFSGYPFSSKDLTTHQGILSAVTIDQAGITSYLVDGTVNSGNSGCPLMDVDGKVIGVVDASRRVRNDLLEKIEKMQLGAISLQGLDLVEIYQALTQNVQLGIGHAVPASYVPEYKEMSHITKKLSKVHSKS